MVEIDDGSYRSVTYTCQNHLAGFLVEFLFSEWGGYFSFLAEVQEFLAAGRFVQVVASCVLSAPLVPVSEIVPPVFFGGTDRKNSSGCYTFV